MNIERFNGLPPIVPSTPEGVRALMRLAFEEGDAAGAMKAYLNVADQIQAIPGSEQMAHELRRWAGTLEARARRARADLAAEGWPA